MRKLYLFIFLFLSACATTTPHPGEFQGICVHPLLNGGAPLPIDETVAFDGEHIIVVPPDGSENIILLSPQCMVRRIRK